MQIVTDRFQKEMKEHGDFSFPFLVSYEKLSGYETGSFLWHWHPEIEVTLITMGEMIYKVNDCTFHLKEGQGFFGNSNTLHAGEMINKKDCAYTSITFEPKLIYGYENSLIYTRYVRPVLKNHAMPAIHFNFSEKWHLSALEAVKNIINLNTGKQPAYELHIVSELQKFWAMIYQYHVSCAKNMPEDKCNFDRIRKILSYVEKNYTEKLTLEEIAAQIHLCESECSRLFKKHMNISLFEFILQYRIEKSTDYLLNTNDSIAEIAESVGFNDSNYFAKVFRKVKGCSPTKYRHKSP